MRKILFSLLTIGVVGATAFGASQAFFSDTETSYDNEITAGSILLDVDNAPEGEFVSVNIDDLKPSYVRWTKHVVKNTGTNPLRLWKHIAEVETFENDVNEPEQEWYTQFNEGQPKNDIDNAIEYDMYIGGSIVKVHDDYPDPTEENNWFGGQNDGGEMIISEADGITLADIESVYVYLGELAPGDEITVWQSYHMKDETENWAQTDSVQFDIEFYGEQVNGTGPATTSLLLENKTANWDPIIGDGIWGILKWAGDGSTFDFSNTLEAHGLQPDTAYSLIYYADPWPGNNPGALLGAGTSDESGDLIIAADPDLGMDLPDPADANYPDGAKLWLVPSSDYDATNYKLNAWNPSDYLFEYNLITYDDLDV